MLQAIASSGSFWAASERLDCSASAVSQRLAALEKVAGQQLVHRSRGRRQIALTEAGRLLLGHAEAIAARLAAAEADLAALSEGSTGRLRIGTYQSVGARILPSLLSEFRSLWPRLEVRLTEGLSDRLMLEMVERGELDLTITTAPLPGGPFESVPLIRDPYVLLVPAASKLGRRRRPVTVDELAGLELLGIRSCQEEVGGFLRSVSVEARVGFHSSDNSVVQGLVASGVGVAIVPLLAIDQTDRRVRRLRIGGFPARQLALACHADRHVSPAMKSFIELAQATCRRVERSG